jgi:hypothetical protein
MISPDLPVIFLPPAIDCLCRYVAEVLFFPLPPNQENRFTVISVKILIQQFRKS